MHTSVCEKEVNLMPEQKEALEAKKKTSKQSESLEESKKIDLYINSQEDQEQGISFMNVFSTLGKRFKIFGWLMLSTLLLGLLVPTLMYTFKNKSEQAVSILALDYEEANVGKDPNGENLDITYLKSSYIVNNALNNVTLSKKLSTAQVQNNLKITGILTDETKQQQEILNNLLQEKNSEYGKLIQQFTLKYRPQFIITIGNTFGNGNNSVVLPADELHRLLSAVTESYNEYFIETYQDRTLPDDYIGAINETTLDYLETLDEVSNSLTYLENYCKSRAELIPDYRTTEGVSFKDLAKIIARLRSTDIDYIYSYVSLNNIYKDKLVLKTYYEMQKRNAELDLVETNANIATLNESIQNYKNGKVVVNTTDGGTPIEVPHTDAEYNRLVLQLTEMNEQKSALEEKIAILTDRLNEIDGPEATAEQKAKAQEFIDNALADSRALYTLVYRSAQELFNSSAYKNRYMHTITTTKRERLSDNLKLFALGAAAGLAVGLIAWIGDAFIIEFRNVKKVNEEKEAM